MSQVKHQPGPSRQCNNLTEFLNESSDEEEEDDGTNCKICKIPSIELTKNIEIGFNAIYVMNMSA